LPIFAKYLSLYLHIFTCTYRGTHTQAHMYNQHTRGMETTRHRSLVEKGGRKALLETLHTQRTKQNKNVRKKTIFTNLQKRFEHIELPSKLLDYSLRSNKSNINQSETTGAPTAGKRQNGKALDMLSWYLPHDTTWRHRICPYSYTCTA